MADQSAIEWTDATWNPVTGCDRVSPGCAHCYALTLAGRLKAMGNARYQKDGDPKPSGPGFGVTLHPDVLEKPLRWRKPRMVFVNSMSDLFHEEIPDEYIVRAFGVMARAERHTFQVLTKRPERMQRLLSSDEFREALQLDVAGWPEGGFDIAGRLDVGPQALTNVWLGVSIENRRFVHRADLLRETPAAIRFISAEPLLGLLVPGIEGFAPNLGDYGQEYALGEWYWPDGKLVDEEETPPLDLTEIDWLIVGGESGPRHRHIDPDWVRALRDACLAQSAGDVYRPRTAFFFKQWGGARSKSGGRELDGREWSEFPAVTA